MNNSVNLIIDFDNLAHRVFHSVSEKTKGFNIAKKGNVVYLVQCIATVIASKIRHISSMVDIEDVYVCADPMVESWRKNNQPSYKGNREKDKDLSKAIKESALAFDTNLKLLFMPDKPYEADDLVSILVNDLVLSGKRSMIVSSDDDFTQLLAWDLTSLYKTNKDLIYTYTDINFYLSTNAKHNIYTNINPISNLLEKVFLGCKSDNIPKILSKKLKVGYFKSVIEIMMEIETDPLNLCISLSEELEMDLDEILKQFEIVSLHHLPTHLKNDIKNEIENVRYKKEKSNKNFSWKKITVNDLLMNTNYKPLI